jgi:hypothetical protein
MITDKNVLLIRYLNRRVDDFCDECREEQFPDERQLIRSFVRFLRIKDNPPQPIKHADGVSARHVDNEDVTTDDTSTLAFLNLSMNGHVGLMWSPILFLDAPMPDALRELLIEVLRFHAEQLESRAIDRRMREVAGKVSGAA